MKQKIILRSYYGKINVCDLISRHTVSVKVCVRKIYIYISKFSTCLVVHKHILSMKVLLLEQIYRTSSVIKMLNSLDFGRGFKMGICLSGVEAYEWFCKQDSKQRNSRKLHWRTILCTWFCKHLKRLIVWYAGYWSIKHIIQAFYQTAKIHVLRSSRFINKMSSNYVGSFYRYVYVTDTATRFVWSMTLWYWIEWKWQAWGNKTGYNSYWAICIHRFGNRMD